MDTLKQEYLKLVPQYEAAKQKYEAILNELQYVPALVGTDFIRNLIDEAYEELERIVDEMNVIRMEIDNDLILRDWETDYEHIYN